MIAESDELLAFSNVLTVTRGRTIRGQVPNAECAQWTNDDRSEPYVGAQVVLQHYRKSGEVKLVQLLYDDLLTWNDWVLEKRTLQPAGLVSVGSDVVNTAPHDGHSKQAAIWETGMDNSPMYDQVTWNASVDKMLIYDVSHIILLSLLSLLYLRVPARVQNRWDRLV
jgi:putative isomerase